MIGVFINKYAVFLISIIILIVFTFGNLTQSEEIKKLNGRSDNVSKVLKHHLNNIDRRIWKLEEALILNPAGREALDLLKYYEKRKNTLATLRPNEDSAKQLDKLYEETIEDKKEFEKLRREWKNQENRLKINSERNKRNQRESLLREDPRKPLNEIETSWIGSRNEVSSYKTRNVVVIQNIFTPSGWMGDVEFGTNYLAFSVANKNDAHSPPTSIRISYKFGPKRWGGIYWQNEPDNWGDKPGNNYSNKGFSKVTFWAKGETGKEVLEFKSGGISNSRKKYHDSYEETTGRLTLTKEWQQYYINLKTADLSSVIGGFCWVASADYNTDKRITFYLVDILLE